MSSRAWLAVWVAVVGIVCRGAAAEALPPVPPVDLAQFTPDQFTDQELDIPYLLHHFPKVINSVVESGPHRGYIDIPVWRTLENNRPYNARILENYLSFAWFYCTDRPWNPYYGHPAVRARLEAVLTYWCDMQSPEGKLSEYGEEDWSLAPTAFATKFMGRTLELLEGGPDIDAALLDRVIAAQRKAIYVTLTDEALYAHGKVYSNQFTNVWPGALAYLKLHPDPEIERLFRKRLIETIPIFQSPAGYFYEKNGPDWSYNFGTHHTNLEAARQITDDPGLLDLFAAKERAFYDWVSYNAVLEPGPPCFILNRSVETRKRVTSRHCDEVPLLDMSYPDLVRVPAARPFWHSAEEIAARRKEVRAALERNWPKVPDLDEFTPYHFLSRDFDRWYPSEAERAAAAARLPYLARENFTHQRVDSRVGVVFTYVRRPTYYAAFTAGEIFPGASQARYGLGLLWNPAWGAALQSQTGSHDSAWGTRAEGAEDVYEARGFEAEIRVGDKVADCTPGASDLPGGDVQFRYALGDKGEKTVCFAEGRILVEVRHGGSFTEIVPMLGPENVRAMDGRVVLDRDDQRYTITHTPSARIAQFSGREDIAGKQVVSLHFSAKDALRYEVRFDQ